MTDYVTDPALLEQLNSDQDYVNDPALLEQLNAPEVGKTMGEYGWGDASDKVKQVAGGIGGMAGDAVTGAWGAIPGKQYIIPGATAFGLAEGLKNLPRAAEAVKGLVGGSGVATPPVAGPVAPNPAVSPSWAGGSVTEAAPAATSMATNLTPAMMLGAPYAMAGLEAQNIRKNPNAPGYANVPYAQMYRGEAATQNRAGAANQMRAVANMPYGNVSTQERAILDEDARMKQAIRKKAFEKVMGPVAPGSF